MMKTVKRSGSYTGTRRRVRSFKLGEGLPSIGDLCTELDEYRDVLLGREDPPVDGILSLMEVADGYFSRACEIEALIMRAERDGRVTRSSLLYKFRTGELRTFKEMTKAAADLGSRRLTAATLRLEREKVGRESG